MRHRTVAVLRARVNAYLDRYFSELVLALLAAFGALGIFAIFRLWTKFSGYEPEWIAQSLASGHGYSFDGLHRWLFVSDGTTDQYFATAWADPGFTSLYAAIIALFGGWSRLIVLLFLFACFLTTAGLIAVITRRLAGPGAGLIALLMLLVTVNIKVVAINASLLAGLWVALLLFVLVAHGERPRLPTSIVLGVVLGVSILTWSSTMVFLPVVVLLLFWLAPARSALRSSVVTVLTVLLLVAPWTVRNYLVFDEFVPVRDGVGHLAHAATIGLTNTFAPERVKSAEPAPFRSSGPFDAVAMQLQESQTRSGELMAWQIYEMRAQLGAAESGLNEAQKDKWLFREAKRFVIANPLATAELAAAKLWSFLGLRHGPAMAVLTLFGLVTSAALVLRERRLLIPMMLTLAYMAPFVIISPLYYRYRYPIEPVIAVLVGASLAHVVEAAWQWASALQIRHPDAPIPLLGLIKRAGGAQPHDAS